MKKIFCLLLTLGFVTSTQAQSTVVVNSKPEEVIVYLSGAEIRFKETVTLKPGENIVRFRNIPASLVSESVQVSVEGVDVISVSSRQEQLLPQQVNPRLVELKDSIGMLEDQWIMINDQVDAYKTEKETLLQNQRIGAPQGGALLSELSKAADFFRERTLKINGALATLNKSSKVIMERIDSLKKRMASEIANTNSSRYSIDVTVVAKQAQQVNFALRYLVSEAGWEASYDIVASEINKPITLKYKAEVYNTTGIDWKNVKISLSTGDISVSASRPNLTTWVLNYSSAANEGLVGGVARFAKESSKNEEVTELTTTSELNTTFEVAQTQTIKADSRPHHIQLTTEMLQASFEYLTIPKVDPSAFLLARITGWEKLNLIDGTANVYYGNTYIGESAINTRLIGDTLDLSLGRDNQIVVSRTKIEDKGSTPVIGGKRTESFVYEIQIRNNRKAPINLKTQDQIPVAQETDITVEAKDISGAQLDNPSGRLQWLKTIAPGEIVKYKIAFEVRYPKNRSVNIRKSREVRTPRYRH